MESACEIYDRKKDFGSNDVNIKFLIQIILSRLALITIITFFFFAFSLYFSLRLPDIYRADITLVPINSSDAGAGGLSSQFGGLASLAGVSLGNSSIDNATLGLEILKSRKFITTFITKNELQKYILAATSWDKDEDRIIYNPELYDEESNQFKINTSVEMLFNDFTSLMSISKNKDNGIIKIEFEHYSPKIAAKSLEMLVIELNETFKRQEIQQAERSIEYLKMQLDTIHVNELKAGLFNLIQKQTETIMLAKASPEYLFQVIDPPIISEKKVKPSRTLITLAFTIFGFILGAALALILGIKANDVVKS